MDLNREPKVLHAIPGEKSGAAGGTEDAAKVEKGSDGNNPISTNEDVKKFSETVEVDGVPLVFKGKIDFGTKEIDLSLRIPNWQEEVTQVDKKANPPRDLIKKGEIGYVAAEGTQIEGADLYIMRIKSYTRWLPRTSKYNHENVHVGRFLMDNLLALADSRGWRVTGFAATETDGRLSNDDVYKWLQRKGFPHPRSTIGALIRQPQQSIDNKQPIMKFLK